MLRVGFSGFLQLLTVLLISLTLNCKMFLVFCDRFGVSDFRSRPQSVQLLLSALG